MERSSWPKCQLCVAGNLGKKSINRGWQPNTRGDKALSLINGEMAITA